MRKNENPQPAKTEEQTKEEEQFKKRLQRLKKLDPFVYEDNKDKKEDYE